MGDQATNLHSQPKTGLRKEGYPPYLQNRELSWPTFNERVLDQGSDETVPMLERWNFVSIFWSNLQEFFMVRVGSLTDLSLAKKEIIDSKSGMTPAEQINAIHERCHELYPIQERVFEKIRTDLMKEGVHHLRPADLDDEQRGYLSDYFLVNVMPFLSPQIINSRHPFPHLENGALYVVVRLDEEASAGKSSKGKKGKGDKSEKGAKNMGAEGVLMGLIPMPRQAQRVIKLPGDEFKFILLEHVIEMFADQVFSMYKVKHTNVICVTRNADLDASEGADEADDDYREHMKRILKRRGRLAPVRLESEHPLSDTLGKLLLKRLNLKPFQTYVTSVPLDLGYTWGLGSMVPKDVRNRLTPVPFTPQWPASLDRNRSIIEQVSEHEVLLSYPYESMDAFVQLLREAANDPRGHLHQDHAVPSGQPVAPRRGADPRRRERQAGHRPVRAACPLRREQQHRVVAALRGGRLQRHLRLPRLQGAQQDLLHHAPDRQRAAVHHPARHGQLQREDGQALHRPRRSSPPTRRSAADAADFFRNMAHRERLGRLRASCWVAPAADQALASSPASTSEIELAKQGEPCGLMFKTNSITDRAIIDKLAEASQAGVPITLLVRGISCIVPGVEGYDRQRPRRSRSSAACSSTAASTDSARATTMRVYLSSADLMTRNMDKRVEIAWPVLNEALRQEIISYFETCLTDTAKLRELLPDGTYTPLRQFVREGEQPFDSQEHLIKQAQMARTAAAQAEVARGANKATIAQVDQKEAAKAVEEKIAASQAAQAAPAPAPTPAAATDAASEQPAPTVTIQPASATSVPQRPHKGGLLSGVLGALFRKGPRR